MEAESGARGLWIATVSAEEAEGLLREHYGARGGSPGLMVKALSLWPEALVARDAFARVMFDGTLGHRRRELAFLVTAVLVGCDFCTTRHGRDVLRAGFDGDQVAQLKRDYRQVELEPAERAMLDYAAVLTVAPWRIEESHVQSLRDAGWDDRGILEINQLVTFMNMIARANRGLGVDAARSHDRSHEQDAMLLRTEIVAGRAP